MTEFVVVLWLACSMAFALGLRLVDQDRRMRRLLRSVSEATALAVANFSRFVEASAGASDFDRSLQQFREVCAATETVIDDVQRDLLKIAGP